MQGVKNRQPLCGENCKDKVIPFYTKDLSDRNLKRFDNILVACKNNDKGCTEALSPFGTMIKDHEARCLEQCRFCKNLIVKSLKNKHILNDNECVGLSYRVPQDGDRDNEDKI